MLWLDKAQQMMSAFDLFCDYKNKIMENIEKVQCLHEIKMKKWMRKIKVDEKHKSEWFASFPSSPLLIAGYDSQYYIKYFNMPKFSIYDLFQISPKTSILKTIIWG